VERVVALGSVAAIASRAARGFLIFVLAGVAFQCLNVTVKTLVHDIQLTLGTTTRAQAVAEGVRLGLI